MAHTSAVMSRNKEVRHGRPNSTHARHHEEFRRRLSHQDMDKQAAEVDRVADLYYQSHADTKKAEDAYKARLLQGTPAMSIVSGM